MHVAFIPYGVKHNVDFFIKELEHQDWQLPVLFHEKGKDVLKYKWIKGHVRILPFGVIELIFPKEMKDLVLTTLGFHKPNRYGHEGIFFKMAIKAFQTALGVKKAPKFNTEKNLLWHLPHVEIIPIGIREDTNVTYVENGFKVTHEAL